MPDEEGVPTKEELAKLPRWAIVAFAGRCARRLQPLFTAAWAEAPAKHVAAVDQAITLCERSAAAGGGGQRPVVLRVWDWWSPSTTEDYAAYFSELESIFESRNPDVDVIFQAVPFANYEQKLATGMLGRNPPDVFQCSVYWAQGFYRRGVLRRLNDLIAATEALQDDKFIKSSLYHTRMGDDIFGIAHIMDGRCLLWNLEMLPSDVMHFN